jgi:hypothetical protein
MNCPNSSPNLSKLLLFAPYNPHGFPEGELFLKELEFQGIFLGLMGAVSLFNLSNRKGTASRHAF